MKFCAKCKNEKSNLEFYKSSKSKDGLQSWCSNCSNDNRKLRYNNNRKQEIEDKELRRKRNRLFFKEFKCKLICEKCGENHPACLEFHHIDPSIKEFDVGKAISNAGKSIETILKEIEKCTILCANCHRKLHFGKFYQDVVQRQNTSFGN